MYPIKYIKIHPKRPKIRKVGMRIFCYPLVDDKMKTVLGFGFGVLVFGFWFWVLGFWVLGLRNILLPKKTKLIQNIIYGWMGGCFVGAIYEQEKILRNRRKTQHGRRFRRF
jgi:hypothetical protein